MPRKETIVNFSVALAITALSGLALLYFVKDTIGFEAVQCITTAIGAVSGVIAAVKSMGE